MEADFDAFLALVALLKALRSRHQSVYEKGRVSAAELTCQLLLEVTVDFASILPL